MPKQRALRRVDQPYSPNSGGDIFISTTADTSQFLKLDGSRTLAGPLPITGRINWLTQTATSGTGVYAKQNATHSVLVPTGQELSLINLEMTNLQTTQGASQLYGLRLITTGEGVDTGAAINVGNFGRADGIYISAAGKSGAASNNHPTGIGIDINRSGSGERSSTHAGTGILMYDYSSTNIGVDGPRFIRLQKINNANSDHVGLDIIANKRAIRIVEPIGGGYDGGGEMVGIYNGVSGEQIWTIQAAGNQFFLQNNLGVFWDHGYPGSSGVNLSAIRRNNDYLDVRMGADGFRVVNHAYTDDLVIFTDGGNVDVQFGGINFQRSDGSAQGINFYYDTFGTILGSLRKDYTNQFLDVKMPPGGFRVLNAAGSTQNVLFEDDGDIICKAGQRIDASELRARDGNGLKLRDDGANYGIFIEDGGEVGINNSAPQTFLHVGPGTDLATAGTGTLAMVQGTANTSFAVRRQGNAESSLRATDTYGSVGTTTNHPFMLRTNGTDALTVDTSQRVGIGNASPLTTLHVGAGADTLTTSNVAFNVQTPGVTAMAIRNATDNIEAFITAGSTQVQMGVVTNHGLALRTNNNDRITIDNAGLVTIHSGNVDILTADSGIYWLTAPSTIRAAIRENGNYLDVRGGSSGFRVVNNAYTTSLVEFTNAGNVDIKVGNIDFQANGSQEVWWDFGSGASAALRKNSTFLEFRIPSAGFRYLDNAGTATLATIGNTGGWTLTPSATGTNGMLVNMPASTTATGITIQYNSANSIRMLARAALTQIVLDPVDFGNNVGGALVSIGRNTNAGTEGAAAGSLGLTQANGTARRLWVDNSADLRIHSNQPTGSSGSPTVADNAGTVVGTQTSFAASKYISDDLSSFDDVAERIRHGAEAIRRFSYRSGSYNGQEFEGVVTDLAPAYGMDRDTDHPQGKSLNEIVILGDLLRAMTHLLQKIEVGQ